MSDHPEVTIHPQIFGGQPCCKDTRFPVSQLLAELADTDDGDASVRAIADDFNQDLDTFREALRWAARIIDEYPRVEQLLERLHALKTDFEKVSQKAHHGVELVDLFLGLGAPENVRSTLKARFYEIESVGLEASGKALHSVAKICIVLDGINVWHPGPQEKADLYKKRCEIRQRVFMELAEEMGIEDALTKRYQQAWEGKALDKEYTEKFKIIEKNPRWRYPLGDGVEPALPKLVEGRWIVDE